MTEIPEIGTIRKAFDKDVGDIIVRNSRRATVFVSPSAIVDMARYVCQQLKFRFVILTGMETSKGIELLYHFSLDRSGLILNIHVILDKEKPEIESLTCLFEAANWIEREVHEILGVNFMHHPNLDKLISDGNWSEGVFPYRKSES